MNWKRAWKELWLNFKATVTCSDWRKYKICTHENWAQPWFKHSTSWIQVSSVTTISNCSVWYIYIYIYIYIHNSAVSVVSRFSDVHCYVQHGHLSDCVKFNPASVLTVGMGTQSRTYSCFNKSLFIFLYNATPSMAEIHPHFYPFIFGVLGCGTELFLGN